MAKNLYPIMDERDFESRELDKFGLVRCIVFNSDVLMMGSDVARCLEYMSPSAAISKYVSAEYRQRMMIRKTNSTNVTPMTFITEAGVNQLVLHSRSSRAKEIQKWIASDVMPSIKRNAGIYITNDIQKLYESDKEIAIEKIKDALDANAKLRKENNEYRELCRMFGCMPGSCSVGTLAKILAQKGYDIGRNRMLDWLRVNGYLCKQSTMYNVPTQKYIKKGYFEVDVKKLISYTTQNPKRFVHIPIITPVGQVSIINHFIVDYNCCNASSPEYMKKYYARMAVYKDQGFKVLHPNPNGSFAKYLSNRR